MPRDGRAPADAHERLRILIVDDKVERSDALERALGAAGYTVLARVTQREDVRAQVETLAPDVIIVDMESPDRDALEEVSRLHAARPRPIVMFVDESDAESVRSAVRAGVSAYVVGGLDRRQVKPIVEAAVARFEQFQELKDELASVRTTLAERKLVDRAKGILMERRKLSEDDAYRLLRKLSMDRKQRLADVARSVIEMAEVL
jgi:response regulator NasT